VSIAHGPFTEEMFTCAPLGARAKLYKLHPRREVSRLPTSSSTARLLHKRESFLQVSPILSPCQSVVLVVCRQVPLPSSVKSVRLGLVLPSSDTQTSAQGRVCHSKLGSRGRHDRCFFHLLVLSKCLCSSSVLNRHGFPTKQHFL